MKENTEVEVRLIMIKYLNLYLSKYELQMRSVMKSMVKQLENYQPITYRQLNSVLKWIEREPPFRKMSKPQIKSYFDELTKPIEKEISYVSLESFFGS